jgi:hypothetical protein
MSLPANFSENPKEELHRYFRNLCIEFKRVIKSSKDVNQLDAEIQRFIDASKQMNWHHNTSSVYRRDESDKATRKLLAEYKRYVDALKSNQHNANPQDLLDVLAEIEQLVNTLKVT